MEHFRKFKRVKINLKRKIKNISFTKLQRINSQVLRVSKRLNLSKWKKEMCISKFSRISGFTPDYIGTKPSKKVYISKPISKTIVSTISSFDNNNTHKSIRDSINKSLNNPREVFSGGYDTNVNHLKNFFRDDSPPIDISVERLLTICKNCPWFVSPHIDYNDSSEMDWLVNFNPKSNPGHYTSKIFQTSYKAHTIGYALKQAKETFNMARKVAMKNFSLWDVFAREKDIKVNASSDPTTRVVWNPEHYFTVCNSWVYQKWMTAIDIHCETSGSINYMIEKEYDGKKGWKLFDKILSYDLMIDADWSLFDSTQYENFLTAAHCIMFSNSFSTKSEMRWLYYIYKGLTEKYVAVPPGIVVRSTKGMPSGHPGVTAVNCVVNLIRWAVIGYEIYGDKYWEKMDLAVYGDDAIIGFKYSDNLFKIDEICAKYGFKGDEMRNNFFITSLYFSDIENSPDYLKRRFYPGGISWNKSKIIDKIIYPAKKRSNYENIEVILNYIRTGPGCDILNNFLLNFCKVAILFIDDYDERLLINENINDLDIDYERFYLNGTKDIFEGYNYERKYKKPSYCILKSEVEYFKKNRYLPLDLDRLKISFWLNQHRRFINQALMNHLVNVPFKRMTAIVKYDVGSAYSDNYPDIEVNDSS